MEKKREHIWSAGNKKKIVILLGVIGVIIGGYAIAENRHVSFKDKNMGIVICSSIGEGVTPENVRYKDLVKLKILQTGFVGYYDTLIDIKKCRNLQKVYINGGSFKEDASYKVTGKEVGKIKTSEEVGQLQQELEEILPSLRRLKEFSFTNAAKNCDITNIDFLKECRKLEIVWIDYANITDYSALQYCTNIKEIDMWGSQIETADELLKLKRLEEICLNETPLSRNKKEMQKLYEAFPDAKIIIE